MIATPPPNWFLTSIARGLQRLLVLSLDRTPAAELLGSCVESWGDALWPGRAWHESDAQRIEAAFRHLAATRRQWPAPADLLIALPKRVASVAKALPRRVVTEEDHQCAMRHVRDLMEQLGMTP